MSASIHRNPLLMHIPTSISGAISPQTSSSLEAVTAMIQDDAILMSAEHGPLAHGAEWFHGPPVFIPTGDLSCPSGHLQSLAPTRPLDRHCQHGMAVPVIAGTLCLAARERRQPEQGLVMIQGISPQPGGRLASFCGQTTRTR